MVCQPAPSPEALKQMSIQSTPRPPAYLQAGALPWKGPSITSRLGRDCLASPLCLTPQFCFSSRVLTVLRGGGRERRSQRCAPAVKRSVTPRSPESPALTTPAGQLHSWRAAESTEASPLLPALRSILHPQYLPWREGPQSFVSVPKPRCPDDLFLEHRCLLVAVV